MRGVLLVDARCRAPRPSPQPRPPPNLAMQVGSDAGVGALCARSAVLGAGLNVRINLSGLKDEAAAREYGGRAEDLTRQAIAEEAIILALVEERL